MTQRNLIPSANAGKGDVPGAPGHEGWTKVNKDGSEVRREGRWTGVIPIPQVGRKSR